MLHSTLPRAFLPPGLGYLGGYYGDDAHVYSTAANYVPCIEDPYARITNQRVQLVPWGPLADSASSSPLDLSLKSTPSVPRSVNITETIVIEESDSRCSGPNRRSIQGEPSYVDEMSTEDVVSEIDGRSSCHNYHGYGEMVQSKDILDPSLQHARDISRSPSMRTYNGYAELPPKEEVLDPTELSPKNYQMLTDQQKVSPSHLDTISYHQQLLMTPQHHLQGINAPMTPPSTPSPPQCHRRRAREESNVTPPRSTTISGSKQNYNDKLINRPKKKHARRLKFDEDTSSPVSGTVILGPDEAVVTGDIDPAFNIVEVTEEARAELAKIENRLGPYQCKLCRHLHDDAFQLAQHRCSRIAHVEYRCPECDKRFSCPANLASHRRWHKPRMPNAVDNLNGSSGNSNASGSSTKDPDIPCTRCDVKFTRPAALRKHLATQHPESNNNVSMANNNTTNNNNDSMNLAHNDDDNNSNLDDLNVTMSGKPLCVPVALHLGNASLNDTIP